MLTEEIYAMLYNLFFNNTLCRCSVLSQAPTTRSEHSLQKQAAQSKTSYPSTGSRAPKAPRAPIFEEQAGAGGIVPAKKFPAHVLM